MVLAYDGRMSEHVPLRIRALRRLNPLIVRMLASPLHRLLSADLLVFEVAGRRSGRRYVLPLSYVPGEGGVVYCCTRPEGSGWWRNVRGGAPVRLVLRGRRTAAHARVLPAASGEALDGLRRFVTRNPGTGALLYAIGSDGGRPQEADLRREVARSVVVRVEPAA